jgi:hypothetical protein
MNFVLLLSQLPQPDASRAHYEAMLALDARPSALVRFLRRLKSLLS